MSNDKENLDKKFKKINLFNGEVNPKDRPQGRTDGNGVYYTICFWSISYSFQVYPTCCMDKHEIIFME